MLLLELLYVITGSSVAKSAVKGVLQRLGCHGEEKVLLIWLSAESFTPTTVSITCPIPHHVWGTASTSQSYPVVAPAWAHSYLLHCLRISTLSDYREIRKARSFVGKCQKHECHFYFGLRAFVYHTVGKHSELTVLGHELEELFPKRDPSSPLCRIHGIPIPCKAYLRQGFDPNLLHGHLSNSLMRALTMQPRICITSVSSSED